MYGTCCLCLSKLWTVLLVRNAVFKLVFLDRFVMKFVSFPMYINVTHLSVGVCVVVAICLSSILVGGFGVGYYTWCFGQCFLLSCTRPRASCMCSVRCKETLWQCIYVGLGGLQFIYYNTTYNMWTSTQYNIINNNTNFKGQLEMESITSRYMCIYINTVHLIFKKSN